MTPVKKAIYLASKTEFTRYFWAGGFATLADFATLLLLTEIAGINYLWSNLVAVSVGMVVNYALCVKWVFHDRRFSSVVVELPVFVFTCIVGIALNELLLWSFVELVKLHYFPAKVIVAFVVFIVNYYLKKVILFRR